MINFTRESPTNKAEDLLFTSSGIINNGHSEVSSMGFSTLVVTNFSEQLSSCSETPFVFPDLALRDRCLARMSVWLDSLFCLSSGKTEENYQMKKISNVKV